MQTRPLSFVRRLLVLPRHQIRRKRHSREKECQKCGSGHSQVAEPESTEKRTFSIQEKVSEREKQREDKKRMKKQLIKEEEGAEELETVAEEGGDNEDDDDDKEEEEVSDGIQYHCEKSTKCVSNASPCKFQSPSTSASRAAMER